MSESKHELYETLPRLERTRRLGSKIFGEKDNVNPLQLLARFVAFSSFAIGTLGATSSYLPKDESCIPNCSVDPEEIARARQEYLDSLSTTTSSVESTLVVGPTTESTIYETTTTEPKFPDLLSVAVYGDSRGYFLGIGSQLVPGFIMDESSIYARSGCPFLSLQDVYVKKGPSLPIDHRQETEAPHGGMMLCDTSTYVGVAEKNRYDVAIVYAGTQFTFDLGGSKNDLRGPLDPESREFIVKNMSETIHAIPADRVVIVDTPPGVRPNGRWEGSPEPNGDNSYAYNDERINAVDSILDEVAKRTGAIFLNNFSDYIATLPISCQPDGIHLEIQCATDTGIWILDTLKLNTSDFLEHGKYVSMSGPIR